MRFDRLRQFAMPLALAIVVGCSTAVADPDPLRNFDYAWSAFDRMYGQFLSKGVDWDRLRAIYRPRLSPESSDEELFDVLSGMLGHLNDGHVWLLSPERQFCASAACDEEGGAVFRRDLVEERFLEPGAMEHLDGAVLQGHLRGGIGYLRIRDFMFTEQQADSVMGLVLTSLGGVTSLVVDVRANVGGTGEVANRVADRFADTTRHFMSSRLRYGPHHDDTLPMHFHVRPRGGSQFGGPVVLLTDRGTASAAERFTLAMRVLPQVTHVGDLTAGMFSVKFRIRMPNGWFLEIPYKDSRDQDGNYWDGIGVPPDIMSRNRPADLRRDRDPMLTFAIGLLEQGPPPRQDESTSLAHVRTPLVEAYFDALASGGVAAAESALTRVQALEPDSWFLDMKLALRTTDPYVFDGRAAEVIPLLRAAMAMYPQVAMTYDLLSAAYMNSDQPDSARVIIERGESVERMYPWEGELFDRVKAALGESGGSPDQ